jgi:hypothetical protein
MWHEPNEFADRKRAPIGALSRYVRTSVRSRFGLPDQRLRRDADWFRPLLFRDRLLLFPDRLLLDRDRLLLDRDRLLLDRDPLAPLRDRLVLERFRVEPPPARRLRVAAALRADAERADLLRFAAARPPSRPPFFAGFLLVFRPRPEPDLRPPPDIAFSVAQARRSASSRGTPRCS